MIGVGIIGAGFFGAAHAAAIAGVPALKLVAASRTDRAALDEFCRQFPARAYPDWRDLLADPAVDAVVIATPHHLHTEAAVQAAQAGKHVLLEKPMAPSLAECDQILQAASAAKVKLMVGHVHHFVRAYRVARQLIASGDMGEVVLGSSNMAKFWFESNRRAWHLDRSTGGGMWLTNGVHVVDRLTFVVGSPVSSVSAQLGTRFHEQKADDVGMAFLRYANGAAGSAVAVGYRTGARQNGTELTCTRGMLRIDPIAGVAIGRAEQWEVVPDSESPAAYQEALIDEWQAFVAAIETGEEPAVSGSSARHIMAVLFAAEESARTQREVAVQVPAAVYKG